MFISEGVSVCILLGNSRIWHSMPCHPGAQWQVLAPTHSPPFRHFCRQLAGKATQDVTLELQSSPEKDDWRLKAKPAPGRPYKEVDLFWRTRDMSFFHWKNAPWPPHGLIFPPLGLMFKHQQGLLNYYVITWYFRSFTISCRNVLWVLWSQWPQNRKTWASRWVTGVTWWRRRAGLTPHFLP